MAGRNKLLSAPPYPVQNAIDRVGANLRTARLRRNLSIVDVAEKIGTNRRVVSDAEHGKPTTGIAIYVALLWVYGLVDQFSEVADPLTDQEGITLSMAQERTKARKPGTLDNDF